MAFDAGSVVAHIKADITGFQDGMNTVKKSVGGVGDTIGNVRGQLDGFSGSIFNLKNAIIGVGVGLLAKDVLESGIAYDRLEKTLLVVAKNMGVTTKQIDNMRTALKDTNTQGSDATQTMLRFLQSGLAGQADFKKFIGVTKDFAASIGVSSAQGIDNFTTAIVSLRPELIENYGIQFNLTDLYGKFADKAGKKVAALTAEEKRMALLNEVYRQGANVKGVYEKTYDTAGKNLLSIKDRLKELKEYIGNVFVPGLTGLTGTVQSFLKSMVTWFNDNKQTVQEWAGAFQQFMDNTGKKLQAFFTTIQPALQKFGDWVIKNKDMIITFITGLGIALGTLLVLATIATLISAILNPVTWVILAIAALYTAWQTNFLGMRDIVTAVVNEIVVLFNNVLMPMIAVVASWITKHWVDIKNITESVWNIITGIIQIAWAIIYGIFAVGLALLTGDWKKAWEAIKHSAELALKGVTDLLGGLIGFLFGWGGLLFDNLTQPFRKAWDYIQDMMNKIKDALDFTKRHSPSVLDIVNRGVYKVNKALRGIEFATTLAPAMSSSVVQQGGQGVKVNQIRIDMAGAIISDEYAAQQMGEKIGDSIIRKLQLNVRF